MRNLKLVAVLAAALCVTLALGGGVASAHKASNTYVCAFGKRAGKAGSNLGNIYLALGITPKSLGPQKCKEFNSGFKGKSENIHSQLGDGTTYCRYKFHQSTYSVVMLVFADKSVAGKSFCNNFHAKGWKKF